MVIFLNKTILYTFFFILLFLFLNVKKNETESFIAINYEEKEITNQNIFVLKLYDFNIYDLNKFNNFDLDIISIIPEENNYDINKVYFNIQNIDNIINESINDYINHMNIHYDNEISYIKTNGFKIYKIKILTTNKVLIDLEKEINFKIIST